MQCPACENELTELKIESLTVDVCENGCGGVWFDNFELNQVDEGHEAAGEKIIQMINHGSASVDLDQKRDCPRCDSQPMMRHFASIKKEIEVDECPACGGFWLDMGELAALRDQYKDDQARNKAANEYIDTVFGPQLNAMRAESEAKVKSARKIAKMLKFVCPTYWIPGDQDWGAF